MVSPKEISPGSISPRVVSVRVILVQPRNPLNILAAARAARNFGLGDIAVVDVQQPAWEEALHKDVDRETPHGPRATSRGWLGDARKFDSLMEAIGDCDWVLGTSSLERRRVARREVISLPDLPARITEACGLVSPLPAVHDALPAIARSHIAILFGSEKRGLANEHLMYCHNLLHIPTAEEKPSMNLGQAVAVVCYELARSGVLKAAGLTTERPGLGPRDSELTEGSGHSAAAGSSANSARAGVSEKPAGSKASGGSAVSEASEPLEVTGNTKELWNAATAREKQALADRVAELLHDRSEPGRQVALGAESEINQQNLIKMLTRLPLSSEDVRRIIKLMKDAVTVARTASAETSERPSPPHIAKTP